MGKNKKKQKKGYITLVCPSCGNDIPRFSKAVRCKYCHYIITPEENNIKEFRDEKN